MKSRKWRYQNFQPTDLTEDLICLDTASDLDDFDPLKSSSSSYSTPTDGQVPPMNVLNPLYNSSYENHEIMSNGTLNSSFSRQDQDLLQDYGLHFNFNAEAQNQSGFDSASGRINTQKQWTKFD